MAEKESKREKNRESKWDKLQSVHMLWRQSVTPTDDAGVISSYTFRFEFRIKIGYFENKL